MQICFHHDRELRLVNPAAPLQQGREERALPQLRGLQLEIPSRGRQGSRARPITQTGAVDAAFERGGADEGGRFRIDQLLVERLVATLIRSGTSVSFSWASRSSKADWSRAIVRCPSCE